MKMAGFTKAAVISATLLFAFDSVCLAQKTQIPVNDQTVEAAINKAVQYIVSQQRADGSWEPYEIAARFGKPANYKDGPTAMAIYTMVASGVPAKDPKIEKALAWLSKPENQAPLSAPASTPPATQPAVMPLSSVQPAMSGASCMHNQVWKSGLMMKFHNSSGKTLQSIECKR